MEHTLHQEPAFDLDALRQSLSAWKAEGVRQVVFEWSTGIGPTVFTFPAGARGRGVKWTTPVEANAYSEIYADFLERTLLPRLAAAAKELGLSAAVRCVDQQPILVMRQRRRQIERLEHAASH